MNKKYIFLPIALLFILSIGYYLFSLYYNKPDNLPLATTKEQPTEDSSSPSESDNQDKVEEYNVFVSYSKTSVPYYGAVPEGNWLVPFFEVDLKEKTIQQLFSSFEGEKTYYRIADGKEIYAKIPTIINPAIEEYDTEYPTIFGDVKEGEYFIDKKKVDLGEQPKTADNIKLFFKALFKDKSGREFYRENILDDIENIERRTGYTITKITDMDKDGNLEYWLMVDIRYDIVNEIYEVVDGRLTAIGYLDIDGEW